MINDKYTNDYELYKEYSNVIDEIERSVDMIKYHVKNAGKGLDFDDDYSYELRSNNLYDAKSRYDQIVLAEAKFTELSAKVTELAPLIEKAKAKARQDALDVCQIWEDIRKELE